MTLIDAARAEALYGAMGAGDRGLRRLGRQYHRRARLARRPRPAIIGKVGDDQLGGIFRHDIRANGVVFETAGATSATPTARCLIFVTPDAQRTMNTYLGACVELGAGGYRPGHDRPRPR